MSFLGASQFPYTPPNDSSSEEPREFEQARVYPNLHAYFATFPHVTAEEQVKLCRTYASLRAVEAGSYGRRSRPQKRARAVAQSIVDDSSPPTVPLSPEQDQ